MDERIRQIIREKFDSEVFDVVKITEGYSHNLFDVKIGWPLRNVIVRFANNKGPEVSLGKEKYVMEELEKLGAPVPRILAFEEGEEGFMVMEKLIGIRLDLIWNSLSLVEKREMACKLGGLLAKIHTVELSGFGNILSEGKIEADPDFTFKSNFEPVPFSPYLRERLIGFFKGFARLLSHKSISAEFAANFVRYLSDNLDKVEYSGKPRLTHGDFNIGHVFVDRIDGELQIVGLIDFEFAQSASPEYDFIKLHRAGFFDNEDLKNSLIKGYGEINEESVKIHRIMRDLNFAQVLLQSGQLDFYKKIMDSIEERIGSGNS